MSLLKVLDRVQQHTPQPFLAPLPSTNLVSCFTLQDKISYWFDLSNPESGWWWIKPQTKYEARLEKEALPHEYLGYLEQLPRFVVIVVETIREGLVVVPYNASDAFQRGWRNSSPKIVYLNRNLNPPMFSTLVVRSMAGTLLFDDYYPLDMKEQERLSVALTHKESILPKGNFEVAWQIGKVRQEEEVKKELERQRQEYLKSEQGKIEDRLNFVGAQLVSYQKQGSNFDVTYTYNGAEFTINLRPDLRVDSAGICLSDEDSNYDLSSICLVMEEARRLRRPGIRNEYFI